MTVKEEFVSPLTFWGKDSSPCLPALVDERNQDALARYAEDISGPMEGRTKALARVAGQALRLAAETGTETAGGDSLVASELIETLSDMTAEEQFLIYLGLTAAMRQGMNARFGAESLPATDQETLVRLREELGDLAAAATAVMVRSQE